MADLVLSTIATYAGVVIVAVGLMELTLSIPSLSAPGTTQAQDATPTKPSRRPPMPDTVDLTHLHSLTDDQFVQLVETNLGDDAPAQLWDGLLHPDVVVRTRRVLGTCSEGIQSQIAERRAEMDAFQVDCFARGAEGKKEWFAAFREYSTWRKRALSFRRLVLRRHAAAKRVAATATATPPRQPARRASLGDAVFRLAYAIEVHRIATLAAGIDPERHDRQLWEAPGGIVLELGSGRPTVAEFLAQTTSKPDFTPPTLTVVPARLEPDAEVQRELDALHAAQAAHFEQEATDA